jgi:glycerol-3-phosphate dehydrogenase
MITITGGKWTTYRQMAEEAVDMSLKTKKLPVKQCCTRKLKIHGYKENPDRSNWLYVYGSDQDQILLLQKSNPAFGERLKDGFDFTIGEVIWAVRNEMARTVDDVLARRIRILYLDARAAIELAPAVAAIMAGELKKDKHWEELQVKDFRELAKSYVLSDSSI